MKFVDDDDDDQFELHFYFLLTCVHSALEIFGQCALQIYLLTYISDIPSNLLTSHHQPGQTDWCPSRTFAVSQKGQTGS